MVLWQISLIESPERRKKRLMALTTNVMRDDSDKVKNIPFDLFICYCFMYVMYMGLRLVLD